MREQQLMPQANGLDMLVAAQMVFWDFDGVIKDSVEVKSDAFEQLFVPYGGEVASRVRQHHEAHGGMSRFEKMPIYLGWAGQGIDKETIDIFCERFAGLVQQAVIDSPWVPGVSEFLLRNHDRQRFVLVTATPQEEMERILAALAISHCFQEVHGAPKRKSASISDVLLRWHCPPAHALMIGDSESDFKAAQANGVPFLLRCTPLNLQLQDSCNSHMFYELTHG